MIYVIVTTSLILKDFELRKKQYTIGINNIKNFFNNSKIIIIENNGKRETFLDDFNVDVFYTNNNFYNYEKGYTELKDIRDCIDHYSIGDDDFVVKITGRYLINKDSNFIKNIQKIDKYDCLIKYGSFIKGQNTKTNDCITGLIGMKCKYIKQIEFPLRNECVEWKWANVTYKISDEKICILENLGIYICPGSNSYFLV